MGLNLSQTIYVPSDGPALSSVDNLFLPCQIVAAPTYGRVLFHWTTLTASHSDDDNFVRWEAK